MQDSLFRGLICFLNHSGTLLFPRKAQANCLTRRQTGASELIAPLLSLSHSFLGSPASSDNSLSPSDIEQFIQDLAHRFAPNNELDEILEPVIIGMCTHESLFRSKGIMGDDASWRGIVNGLEMLARVKSVGAMITRLAQWNPKDATASDFEKKALFGPLCRLGIFPLEWVRPPLRVLNLS